MNKFTTLAWFRQLFHFLLICDFFSPYLFFPVLPFTPQPLHTSLFPLLSCFLPLSFSPDEHTLALAEEALHVDDRRGQLSNVQFKTLTAPRTPGATTNILARSFRGFLRGCQRRRRSLL